MLKIHAHRPTSPLGNLLRSTLTATALSGTAALLACGQGQPSESSDAAYADFRAGVYREPGTGIFIVDGDTPIVGEQALREFFTQLQDAEQGTRRQGLAVYNIGSTDIRWSDDQKGILRYCVSTAFGGNYEAVVAAVAVASADWSATTHGTVRFYHDASQDGSCNSANTSVLFDVSPTSGQPYLARAFFPNSSRADRSVLVDSSSFSVSPPWTLAGILRHELGHVLGFRHERTRPEAGKCFEDNNWRALTDYDSASVMHDPQCNGTNTGDLVLTAKDRVGAAALYPPVYAASLSDVQGRWFRMTNSYLGPARSLDTYASGYNTPFMGDTGNYSGQAWKLSDLGGGYFQLTNSFLGDGRPLDTSGSAPNQPFMNTAVGRTGQYWKLTPYADHCFRLSNMFLGDARSLDTYSSGNNDPFMGDTGSYSGQCWHLSPEPGRFMVNQLSGRCIDVDGAPGTANGARVQLYDCEYGSGSTDQRWQMTPSGFIRNTLSGKCLDVAGAPGTTNGAILQLWDCELDAAVTDQKWEITSDGYIRNLLSGKCIDVAGAPGTANGTTLELWDCEYGSATTDQRWF